MGIYIRKANVSDSSIIGHIHAESCRAAYKNIFPKSELVKTTAKIWEKYFYEKLSKKLQEIVIIYKDDIPAGFMSMRQRGFKAHGDPKQQMQIQRLYILPAYWNQGLGRELINWAIKELKKRGYKKINLWVYAENVSAQKFYEKMGFVYDGTQDTDYVGKEIIMCRYVLDIS